MQPDSSLTARCRIATPLASSIFLTQTATRFVPSNLFPSIRILGVIEAGWPSPAEEELLDTMSFDEYLAPNKEASYI